MPESDPRSLVPLAVAAGVLVTAGLAVGAATPHWIYASVLLLTGLVLAVQVLRLRIRELRDRM